jgi:YXWGXW repeat-containing protein
MNFAQGKHFLRTGLFVGALLFALPVFAQVSIGVRIGPPPPVRVVRVLPPTPGPEFIWIQGYWYPQGRRYRWHEGYWTRPPYPGARWVGPHHDGERFYEGYWEGEHGRVEHDHRWDHDRERDFHDRDRDRDHDRDRDRERDHDR